MIARCPFCNSIWVCWNWFDSWANWGKEGYEKANPHIPPNELKRWGHECWNCGDEIGGHCFETAHKVRNGIPYRVLKWLKG